MSARQFTPLIFIGVLFGFLLCAFMLYLAVRHRPSRSSSPQSIDTSTSEFKEIQSIMTRLSPLHEKIHPAKPGEWLAQHTENGQTFNEYVAEGPITPQGVRKFIYIQPIGNFTESQRKIVDLTADFMARYFGVEVKVQPALAEGAVPETARRINRFTQNQQFLTRYILYGILKPSLPEDAAASIAFTATDLWPGDNWNYVFGEASTRDRVGVWSINRNGNPDENADAFKLCLLRTLKTATHETGHMFSIQHCIVNECNMNGSNHLPESDAKPLEVCPICLGKILFATKTSALQRFQKLAAFCHEQGLKQEEEVYQKHFEALKTPQQ